MDVTSLYQAGNTEINQIGRQGEIVTEKNDLGMDEFFKLLTAQLTSQDPLEPMSDTEFISQMANFSSLAQMEAVADNTAALQAQSQAVSVQSLLGKTIIAEDTNGERIEGIVTEVRRVDGEMKAFVGEESVHYNLILNISETPNGTE